MSTPEIELSLSVGLEVAGGYYAGKFRVGDEVYALIVAPKAGGDHANTPWSESLGKVGEAVSFCDGRANTLAMASSGSALAQWALDLRINDFADWYLPSRDELEILYRQFAPGPQSSCGHRNGDNPSSIPPGYPYGVLTPVEIPVEAFRARCAEAFRPTYYWSSTQYAASAAYAWCQSFALGTQGDCHKHDVPSARAVRRFRISQYPLTTPPFMRSN